MRCTGTCTNQGRDDPGAIWRDADAFRAWVSLNFRRFYHDQENSN